MAISPFAPQEFPEMPSIPGVRLAACEAGIRYKGRKDLLLCLFDAGTAVGGALTTSKTASAPVEWCRKILPIGTARALIVNSGNSNAFTGMRGHEAVRTTVERGAVTVGCNPDSIYVASTGVIGQPLDPDSFTGYLAKLASEASHGAWQDAARAIMTTDTYPKLTTGQIEIDGVKVTLNGIAKGSGMIAPDMATMLAFFFTDAPISSGVLQSICTEAVKDTFNAITVDSDTSTSDTVLLFATGATKEDGLSEITDLNDTRLEPFAQLLEDGMRELSHQIVKDGEGASKFVTIKVCGAETKQAARRIAFSIANSPLVKTAIAGEDPNWGRIVMAVGKAGETADRDKLSIWFGDLRVAHNGCVDPDYKEAAGAAYMKQSDLKIIVDVGIGNAEYTVYTCDLTHEYISINADYRS